MSITKKKLTSNQESKWLKKLKEHDILNGQPYSWYEIYNDSYGHKYLLEQITKTVYTLKEYQEIIVL